MTAVTLLCVITFVLYFSTSECEDGINGLPHDSLDMSRYNNRAYGYMPYNEEDTVQRNSNVSPKTSLLSSNNAYQPLNNNAENERGFPVKQGTDMTVNGAGSDAYKTFASSGVIPAHTHTIDASNVINPETASSNMIPAVNQQPRTDIKDIPKQDNDMSKPASASDSVLPAHKPVAESLVQATEQQTKSQSIGTWGAENTYKPQEIKPLPVVDQVPSIPLDNVIKPGIEKTVKLDGGPTQALGDLSKYQNGNEYAPQLNAVVDDGIKQDNLAMGQAWNALKTDVDNNAMPEMRKPETSVDQQVNPMINSYIKPDSRVESKLESGQVLKNMDAQVNKVSNSNIEQDHLVKSLTGNALEPNVNNVAIPDSGKPVPPVEQEVKPVIVSNSTPDLEKLHLGNSLKETADTGNLLTDTGGKMYTNETAFENNEKDISNEIENTNENKEKGFEQVEQVDDLDEKNTVNDSKFDGQWGEIWKNVFNKNENDDNLEDDYDDDTYHDNKEWNKQSDGKEKEGYQLHDGKKDEKSTSDPWADDIFDNIEDITDLGTTEDGMDDDDTNAGKDMFESAHHFDSNIGLLGGAKVFDTRTTPRPWKTAKTYKTVSSDYWLMSSYSKILLVSFLVIAFCFVLVMNRHKVERYVSGFGLKRQPANNGHFFHARASDEHKVLLDNEYA